MNRDLITFRSITPAQYAQRILRQGGIESVLGRTPRALEQAGCGYCLRLRPEDRQRALLLMQQSAVPYKRVFTMQNGILEEVVL